MITLTIILVVACLIGTKIASHKENAFFTLLFGLLTLFCLVAGISCAAQPAPVPAEYTEQAVLIVGEDGVVKEVNDTYYQDANGDYFIKHESVIQRSLNPFYRPDFEKVEPPVLPQVYCGNCCKGLDIDDNFCAGCGNAVKE